MRFLLIVVLLIAVAVLIGFVVGYNRIRAADVRVDEALGGIDVQLTRRASLIPALVSTVGTFAAHEKAILDHVSDARAALTSATVGKSVAQRSAAEQQFDSAVGQVMALGQTYPQLQLVEQFPQSAAESGRYRGQAGVCPAVLQRRRRDPEPLGHHDSLDVRREERPGCGSGSTTRPRADIPSPYHPWGGARP